jgi:lambda family phage tail tape measure protein
LRIKQSQIESEKQLQLRGQGDIAQIEINAKAEAAKAKEEIFAKERLTVAQKETELAAKVIEINAKRDTDIAKNKLQTTIRVMNEEMAAREQYYKDIAAEEDKINASRVSAQSQVRTLGEQTTELQARFALQQSILDLSTIDQERQTKIFDVIQQQKAALESLNAIKDLPNDERLKREQEINAEYAKRIGLINAESDAKLARENDFSAGVKESMKRYEESMTPLKQGQQVADAVFSNMNSAVDRFVENGKFSFKGFAASVVQDLIKIQMKAAATQLFNSVLSTFGFGLPGKAAGGPVSAGQPYIVGERGPEVFMPNNAGSIIPNNQIGGGGSAFGGGQAITYNIQAVDAMSFKQMLAQDPSFLHAVAEQGRRTIPATRR